MGERFKVEEEDGIKKNIASIAERWTTLLKKFTLNMVFLHGWSKEINTYQFSSSWKWILSHQRYNQTSTKPIFVLLQTIITIVENATIFY